MRRQFFFYNVTMQRCAKAVFLTDEEEQKRKKKQGTHIPGVSLHSNRLHVEQLKTSNLTSGHAKLEFDTHST